MIETRKKSLILDLILGAIVLIIAFIFWPGDHRSKQSNEIDENKTQIEIKVKRINIRKEPSVTSDDIGDVYYGEVYTVLSHVDSSDYYWYHIKTSTGIEGYIASGKEEEYVSLLSGYVDRTPPVISTEESFLLFYNGEVNYDSVTCKDEYSTCTMTYDLSDPDYITFKVVDEDLNESTYSMRYYNIYPFGDEYTENDSDISAVFNKVENDGIYTINTTFSINKIIKSNNKSRSYTPIIDFYDQEFNKVENVLILYNPLILPGKCINKSDYTLKDGYYYNDLLKGSTLCINYSFDNKSGIIKYVSFGFSSDENYTNKDNILASYYSKYFIIE